MKPTSVIHMPDFKHTIRDHHSASTNIRGPMIDFSSQQFHMRALANIQEVGNTCRTHGSDQILP